jgi:hypothetical protein
LLSIEFDALCWVVFYHPDNYFSISFLRLFWTLPRRVLRPDRGFGGRADVSLQRLARDALRNRPINLGDFQDQLKIVCDLIPWDFGKSRLIVNLTESHSEH